MDGWVGRWMGRWMGGEIALREARLQGGYRRHAGVMQGECLGDAEAMQGECLWEFREHATWNAGGMHGYSRGHAGGM